MNDYPGQATNDNIVPNNTEHKVDYDIGLPLPWS